MSQGSPDVSSVGLSVANHWSPALENKANLCALLVAVAQSRALDPGSAGESCTQHGQAWSWPTRNPSLRAQEGL